MARGYQTRGTTTNLSKLVVWNTDLFLELSDVKDCLICVSPQDKYLLGQALDQMRWRTRWISEEGTPSPDDIVAISGRLDQLLSQENCIDFCQIMIDCLNDPESGVAEAFANVLGQQTALLERESSQIQNTNGLMGDTNPTCDEDILFGQCLQLAEYMDQQHRDLFEVIEVVTNTSELIAQIFGGGSGRTAATIDTMLTWITFVQNSISENYDAQITQTYLEELACEWFCLALNNDCQLTPEILFNTMKERLSSAITIDSLINESLNFLISGTWSGQEIADFMYFAQFAIRAQVGRFLDETAWYDILFRMSVFANDPNSDWQLLCDECECPEVTEIWDFTTEDHQPIWFPRPSQAGQMLWVDGQGWRGSSPGGSQLMTERYSVIYEVIVTTTAGNCRVVDFGEAILSDCPFDGEHEMVNELLVENTVGSGNTFITEIEIRGCLA